MSYEARMSTLRHFVRHYSRCPSVSDIVLVWNKGEGSSAGRGLLSTQQQGSQLCRFQCACRPLTLPPLALTAGKPPVPERDFDSAVPVRVRLEALNSLNNRFRQDPLIRNRCGRAAARAAGSAAGAYCGAADGKGCALQGPKPAMGRAQAPCIPPASNPPSRRRPPRRAVLSLDDDIMVPCSDLERGFATWRMQPAKMVGFYPRLIEGTPLEFRGERCAWFGLPFVCASEPVWVGWKGSSTAEGVRLVCSQSQCTCLLPSGGAFGSLPFCTSRHLCHHPPPPPSPTLQVLD